MIHFNTAGSGLLSEKTLNLMQGYLQAEHQLGAYEAELDFTAVLEVEVYANIARLLGAEAHNIALFDGATKAWVTALDSLTWFEGARVLVTPYEYAGNLIALSALHRLYGVVVEVMPLLANGDLDLAWLARNISMEVRLVSIVHIPSCCGIVNDIEGVGNIVRDYPCLYFVDACQSTGILPLKVQDIGCDVLTAAGRKFLCGPRGTGFAYLSERFLAVAQPRFTDLNRASVNEVGVVSLGGRDARCFEYAERNNAAVIGLNQAVKECLANGCGAGLEIYQHLYRTLARAPYVSLIAPGARHEGIISFIHSRYPAVELVSYLRTQGVNCWSGYSSHTPYYMLGQGCERFVRVSINEKNSLEDADVFMSVLARQ